MNAEDADYSFIEEEGATLIQESSYVAGDTFRVAGYNPDVLLCLANLSNDEVFTPPNVANAMLDLLPEALWSDPTVTFLDPCCKSGIFLREIAKRLIKGLEPTFSDLQERLDHIFKKQLFAFAITELTALLSRRSVYCSKQADGRYSLTDFDTPMGNILLPEAQHTWDKNGRCIHCGATQKVFGDRTGEQHAYAFIHALSPEEIFRMKFDVIIGNPPYQLDDGGAQASATPIYQHFVNVAKKLSPRYMSFIIPARWYSGGKGLDEFREEMITDKRIRVLHDYLNSDECFAGVEIKGGVCYFLWNRDHTGPCSIVTHQNKEVFTSERYLKENGADTFIRHSMGVNILRKVQAFGEPSFSPLVSSQRPFGMRTFVKGKKNSFRGSVTLYQNGGIGYIPEDAITRNESWLPLWKVYISAAYNAGDNYPHQILGKPLLGGSMTCCTETYLVIGPFNSEEEARNVSSYISTCFFRFLVSLIKISQHATAKVYSFVPLQDFSKAWTDEELYAKYGLTGEEIAFIESMVKPMGEV